MVDGPRTDPPLEGVPGSPPGSSRFTGRAPSDRDDGQRYVAFLFRNAERTVFGIREWLGNKALVRNDALERMAHRIVTESDYRREFISDDLDLIEMWKRH